MAYIRSSGGGIPSSLKTDMNNVLNKKLSTSTTYAPSVWAEIVNLLGKLPERTASGSIAHFDDGADDVPLKTARFYFNPVQAAGTPTPSSPISIYGHTGLNISKSGKNLLPLPTETMSSRGVDLIPQSDGTVKLEGTATGGTAVFDIARSIDFYLPAGTYYVNQTQAPYGITVYSELNGTATLVKSGGGSFTLTEKKKMFIRLAVTDGVSTDVFVSLQLEVGNTATTFEPYTAPVVYPVSWTSEGTLYGGYYDADTGELWGTHIIETYTGAAGESWTIASDGTQRIAKPSSTKVSDYTYSNMALITSASSPAWGYFRLGASNLIINLGTFTDVATFKTWLSSNNLQIAYELATPVKVADLDPTVINSYLGVNNIYHDANGDTDVTFRADIDLLITELGG